jgi:hypothetical protein
LPQRSGLRHEVASRSWAVACALRSGRGVEILETLFNETRLLRLMASLSGGSADEAKALGLNRFTVWTVVKTKHKLAI